MNTQLINNLLNSKEASAYLGFSESSLEAMRARNTGPAWHRVGERGVRYRIEDLDAYLAGNRVNTNHVRGQERTETDE